MYENIYGFWYIISVPNIASDIWSLVYVTNDAHMSPIVTQTKWRQDKKTMAKYM